MSKKDKRSGSLTPTGPATLLGMILVQSALAVAANEQSTDTQKANPLNNVYFGEQHLHTSASPDAFEWSSQPNSKNLHHNVFFRNNTGPDAIFSSFDSVRREDLWTYQEKQREMGNENFSIPHNSNVSNSAMFALHDSYGEPIDKSFVRNALIDGVGFEEMIGANPYKYAIVGGGDSHIAASVNEEFNYPDVHGNTDKTAEIRLGSTGSVADEPAIFFGTPGATVVWAPENTRAAIFDGMLP